MRGTSLCSLGPPSPAQAQSSWHSAPKGTEMQLWACGTRGDRDGWGSSVLGCSLDSAQRVHAGVPMSWGPREISHAPSLSLSLSGDGYYLAVGGAVAQHNWTHISTVLQDLGLRCQLLDSSEEMGMLSVQGPAR